MLKPRLPSNPLSSPLLLAPTSAQLGMQGQPTPTATSSSAVSFLDWHHNTWQLSNMLPSRPMGWEPASSGSCSQTVQYGRWPGNGPCPWVTVRAKALSKSLAWPGRDAACLSWDTGPASLVLKLSGTSGSAHPVRHQSYCPLCMGCHGLTSGRALPLLSPLPTLGHQCFGDPHSWPCPRSPGLCRRGNSSPCTRLTILCGAVPRLQGHWWVWGQ